MFNYVSAWYAEITQKSFQLYGGFLSHGGTPFHHPFTDGFSIINHPSMADFSMEPPPSSLAWRDEMI